MPNYQTTFIKHSQVKIISKEGKQHIAVIGGGMSAEREVSLVSSKRVNEALLQAGYKVTFIDMGADIALTLTNIQPDIVFNCLHGTYGEDGCLPGLLNIMRIPYTHSGVLASALAFDKVKSKELFRANNIKTAESMLVRKSDNLKSDPITRPYVVKPLTQGSSIGVEIVFPEDSFNFEDYKFPYGDTVMVEKYIPGREFQVAVLNGKAIGALEIKLLKRRFYDYDSKYKEGFAEHLLPPPIPSNDHHRLLSYAEKAYEVLDCRGMGRVEFIYSPSQQEFFILEVNTHTGLTPLSSYPEIAEFYGISFSNLCQELLKTATIDQ